MTERLEGSRETQRERCPSCETVELNQERLVSAVMIALHDVQSRCSADAAVQWFQQAYSEAIKTLRNADEGEVFKVRKGMPTLTGRSTPAAPETPLDSDLGVWTEEELKHFAELASGPQPAPTEHLVRAMSSPKKEES